MVQHLVSHRLATPNVLSSKRLHFLLMEEFTWFHSSFRSHYADQPATTAHFLRGLEDLGKHLLLLVQHCFQWIRMLSGTRCDPLQSQDKTNLCQLQERKVIRTMIPEGFSVSREQILHLQVAHWLTFSNFLVAQAANLKKKKFTSLHVPNIIELSNSFTQEAE